MIDFDPSKYLTLTPAAGEERIHTDWICPDDGGIARAFLSIPEPVEAMGLAQHLALKPFIDSLHTIENELKLGQLQASRAWIGEPIRDHRDWSDGRLWYPLRFAFHSPAKSMATIWGMMKDDPSPRPAHPSPLSHIERCNDDPTTLLAEAASLMRAGDYEHGLPLYEFRHQTPQGHKQWKDFLTMPHWDGRLTVQADSCLSEADVERSAEAKTPALKGPPLSRTRPVRLLIHAEQGYGDTIQFARYVPWLNDIDADFMVNPCLVELMKTLTFKGRVSDKLDVEKQYDFHVPVCSLALAMDPKMQETPRSPYLRSDKEKYWHWRDRIGREGYKVGICWTGSRIHKENNQRSRTIEQVIKACPKDARLFNLQKGEGREQLNLLPPEIQVQDFTDDLHDFSDTAAFIDNLDLIVTVDTAIAHLAGALGRPVKLLVGKNAEWRWGEDSDRTRWYSSMVIDRTEA